MGAFPILQEGNTRANLNVTEFRTSHYILGRKKLLYDSHFGISKENMAALGKQGKYLEMALKNYREGRINLPIRAATGSVNKEIEKQNLMLLLNNVRAHGQQMAQLLQALANPMAPPDLQHFLASFAMSSTFLMKRICKEFGIEDPSATIPDIIGIEDRLMAIEKQVQQQKAQAQLPQPGAPPQPQPGQPPQPGGPPQLPPPAGPNGAPPGALPGGGGLPPR